MQPLDVVMFTVNFLVCLQYLADLKANHARMRSISKLLLMAFALFKYHMKLCSHINTSLEVSKLCYVP